MSMQHKKRSVTRILLVITVFVVGISMVNLESVEAASRPSKVRCLKVVKHGYNSLRISWKKAKGAKKYQVYRATSRYGRYKRVKTTRKRAWVSRSLKTGTKYYYQVRGIRGSKKGRFSIKRSNTPKLKAPTLSAKTYENGIKVTWRKVSGAHGYQLYRRAADETVYSFLKDASGSSTYDDSALAGSKYYYKVRAYRVVSGKKVYSSDSKVKSAKKQAPIAPFDAYINYRGETESQTTKIALGQTWDDALNNSIGSVDKVVSRKYHTVYTYDTNCDGNTGDFSSYLEVYVGKDHKVAGWITNQPELAVWEGAKIQTGVSKSNYQSYIDQYDGERVPGLYLHNRYMAAGSGSSTTYNTDTGKVLWGGVLSDCAIWVDQAQLPRSEEAMAENYTNMIRKSYGNTVLTHSNGMYSGLGGAKDAADDWAAYGDIRYNGNAHMTSGSIKSELMGKTSSERRTMCENATGAISFKENAYWSGASNEIGRSSVEGWYYSAGHRNTMLADFTAGSYSIWSIAVGISSTVKGTAAAMWIGY